MNGKHDVWTHRLVVAALAGAVLLCGVGVTVLAGLGKEVPPALPALGYTAMGALSGMLAAIMAPRSGYHPPPPAPPAGKEVAP